MIRLLIPAVPALCAIGAGAAYDLGAWGTAIGCGAAALWWLGVMWMLGRRTADEGDGEQ